MTRLGTLLTAPGWTWQVPTVATVSLVLEAALAARVWRSNRKDEFRGGAEGVATVGHQESAGVAAETVDDEAIPGGGGDAGDDAEGQAFAFEQRTLFDMEFNPGVVVALRGDGRRRDCR